MSVINSMLKKLDERGVPAAGDSPAAARPPVLPLARPNQRPAWRLPAIVLAGGAVIAATALADWPRLARPDAAPKSPAAMVATTTATDAATTPATPTSTTAPTTTAGGHPATSATDPATTAMPAASKPALVAMVAPATHSATHTATQSATPARARDISAAVEPTIATAALPLPASLLTPVPLPSRIDKRLIAPSSDQRVAALFRQATELAQAGQRRTALERAHAALAIDERHAPTRLLAAVLEHESGQSERAALLLRDGLQNNPGDTTLALLLARIQVAQGEATQALATLDQHGVTGADADGLRGGILAQQGEFKRSLGAYENAARHQPANPMWWLGLGVALESEGQGARARQAYARAQAIGLPREDLATYVDQRLRSLD